jgi:hypothetical protein
LALYLAVWGFAQWQHRATKKAGRMKRATGSCKVVFEPEELEGPTVSGDKVFHGALEGSSRREVLNLSDRDAAGSGYIHVERVVGILDGHSGTFLLACSGMKDDGTSFAVVPGSGTGALNGISGTMTIRIRGEEPVYDFEYTLDTPEPREALLPHSLEAAPDEPQRDTGRVVRSVLPAISVVASQQAALQRMGVCALHVQRIFTR